MFNTKTFVVTFVAAAVLVIVATHTLFSLIQDQQRQIDQLCAAMPYALTWDRTEEVKPIYYDELPAGDYILCFADIKAGQAIAEHYLPVKPAPNDPPVETDSGSKPKNRRYVHLFKVPAEVLKDWEWREIRSAPDLLRQKYSVAYSHN